MTGARRASVLVVAILTAGVLTACNDSDFSNEINACQQNGGLPQIQQSLVPNVYDVDINGHSHPVIVESVTCKAKVNVQ